MYFIYNVFIIQFVLYFAVCFIPHVCIVPFLGWVLHVTFLHMLEPIALFWLSTRWNRLLASKRSVLPKQTNKQTNTPPPQQNKNQNQPCLLSLWNDLHLGVHSEFVEVKTMYLEGKTGFILFYVLLRSLPPALIFWVGWLGRQLWRILNSARLWKMDTFWLSGIRISWVVGKMRGGENAGQEYGIQNGLQCSPLQ